MKVFMRKIKLLSVADFAKLSRTSRDTLLYYDSKDLLRPVKREDNNYRYYSCHQLGTLNVIRVLQKSGMKLSEVKDTIDHRTPALIDEVFLRQIAEIDTNINELIRSKKLLLTMQKMINSVSGIDEKAITVQPVPEEAILAGELNDYSDGRTDYDALQSFYQYMHKKYPNLDLNYPVWGIFSAERIKNGDWSWPDRFYFYNPDGCDKRPAGTYAIGYTHGGYGQCDELYKRMIDYVNHHGLDICGDVYEEYPLNEVCVPDENNFLIRVMIPVQSK